MTYQVTMRARDGVLIASDRREISLFDTAKVAVKNNVVKIRVSPDGRFAWAYSGHDIAPIYSRHILRAFEIKKPESDDDVKGILGECGLTAIQEWRQQIASGPIGPLQPVVVMASGTTKRIYRSVAMPTTEPEEIKNGLCVTGQTANWAAFLPERFYSRDMSVDELSWLAASSVRIGHDFDALCVDRLDLAIYRDESGRFELIDGDPYWEAATEFTERLDASIRQALGEQASNKRIS